MNKPKLVILEGFDRIGKDTLLRELESKNVGFAYIQQTPDDMPNYRNDKIGFYNFLTKWLDDQSNDLIELSKTNDVIYLSRFFASDYVYSQIFNRPNIANKFKNKLENVFDIENVVFLWKTYEDYSMRCMDSKSELEYNKLEFDRIQQLYIKFAKENASNTNIIYVENKDSIQEIYDKFVNRKNITTNNKIKSMFDLFFDLKDNTDLIRLKNIITMNPGWYNESGFVFTGVGKNWYICEKVVKTFLSMGIHAQALDPVHALHGDLGMIDGQYVFFISKSGTTEELIRLAKSLRALRNQGIKDCVMIGFCLNNEFEDKDHLYDYLIKPSDKWTKDKIYEFDKKNIVPTLSINIMQMILDDFGVMLFETSESLVDNYKYNHLAGENGRRLGVDKLLKEFTK